MVDHIIPRYCNRKRRVRRRSILAPLRRLLAKSFDNMRDQGLPVRIEGRPARAARCLKPIALPPKARVSRGVGRLTQHQKSKHAVHKAAPTSGPDRPCPPLRARHFERARTPPPPRPRARRTQNQNTTSHPVGRMRRTPHVRPCSRLHADREVVHEARSA